MLINIYTDGACTLQHENKPGGWGVVFEASERNIQRQIAGCATNTTNNKMELMGVIKALEMLKDVSEHEVKIHMDSNYTMLGILNRQEYESKDFKKVANPDLLKELYVLLDKHNFSIDPSQYSKTDLQAMSSDNSNLTFIKVKGHSDNPGNEKADKLATRAKVNQKNFDSGKIALA